MATVTKRAGKYGVSWRAQICVNGQRKTATFSTRAQAYDWAEETERRLRSGLPLQEGQDDNDMDFAQAARRYEEEAGRRRKPGTREMYHSCVVRLVRAFGGKTLRGIARKDLIDYRDARLQQVGPASIIHDFSFLRGMYKAARLFWGISVESPVQDVSPPAPPKNRMALLSEDEMARLLAECSRSSQPRLRDYVLLMLHTAMRPSEAAGLKWAQVKWEQRMLDLTATKTDPRRVPLTTSAFDMLTALQKSSSSEWVFLPAGRAASSPRISDYFRTAFRNACKRAGLSGFTLYGLRHSAASHLIMRGVDIRTVAEIMGHRHISQTMKYTHFLDAHFFKAMSA